MKNTTLAGGLMCLMLSCLLPLGCDRDEARLQAQADRLVDLQSEVAESASQLVESDAAARADWVHVQDQLQAERVEVGRQRDQLEEDRRQIASQRLTQSLVATALVQLGLVIVCSLPLLICWLMLRRGGSEGESEVVCSVLLDDLSGEHPKLFGPSNRLSPPD